MIGFQNCSLQPSVMSGIPNNSQYYMHKAWSVSCAFVIQSIVNLCTLITILVQHSATCISWKYCCSLASLVVCEELTLASGVTVLQPHSNVVNSEIFYQCEESGFSPSSNSSLCEEDGVWSPDPSQVMCKMIITAAAGNIRVLAVLTWLTYYYILSLSIKYLIEAYSNLLDPTYLCCDGWFLHVHCI